MVARNVKARINSAEELRCFFTGVKLGKSNRSVEHLVPQCYFKHREKNADWNTVFADTHINSLIGNAPLVVKYGLKEALKKIVVFDPDNKLTPRECADRYVPAVKAYLEQFKVHKVYCWGKYNGKKNENAKTIAKKRADVRCAYIALLTREELELFEIYERKK